MKKNYWQRENTKYASACESERMRQWVLESFGQDDQLKLLEYRTNEQFGMTPTAAQASAYETYTDILNMKLEEWARGSFSITDCEDNDGGMMAEMMDSFNALFGMDRAYGATAAGAIVAATAALY